MRIDYSDVPKRQMPPMPPPPKEGEKGGGGGPPSFDFSGQPKWNIPEAVVIKVAVVGRPMGRKGSPTQLDDIIKMSMECIDAGACCVHYHAPGETAQDWERGFHSFTDPIKDKYGNDVVFDLSLATRDNIQDEKYLAEANLCEFTPVNLSMLGGMGSEKKLVQAEVQVMQDNGVKPELAIYCDGDIDRARDYVIDTGIAQKPTWWDLLPSYGVGCTPMLNEFAMAETLMNQVRQIKYLDPDAQIMVAGCGRPSSALITMSILLGLHVKVGMEDVYFWNPRTDDVMDDNIKSVTDAVAIARIMGRRPATANEYRAFAGLPQR